MRTRRPAGGQLHPTSHAAHAAMSVGYEQNVMWMGGVVLVWLLATLPLLPVLGRLISTGQPPMPPPVVPPVAAESGFPRLRLVPDRTR